jgi:cytosine/adenosine deaminase-related metal-dependent hydrolase
MAGPTVSRLPIEVELVFEVMPCLSMRQTYDSASEPHPCSYFGQWGYYHTYDYASAGPPELPQIDLPVVYAGKRQVVPELLSGCRKAPILCVGINPNLPGWTESTRNAIHPYFEDALQYAHYFRYRTRDKLRVPESDYENFLGTARDEPSSPRPLTKVGADIPVEPSRVLMYAQYQTLLDGLAQRRGWQGHKLAVGEDIAYANMVACPSARWVTRSNQDDPAMPVMGTARGRGIVGECFYERRYFLRQLVQSLPAVILVFSQTTARELITALAQRFTAGNPKPDEPLADLFEREIRLRYGRLTDGNELDARVIFMPHASARPEEFAAMRDRCIDRLEEEVGRGNLVYRPETGHLWRGRGMCVFCSNALYTIGTCDYEQELRPIAAGEVQPLAEGPAAADPLVDKDEQMRLLADLLGQRTEEAPLAIMPLAEVPAAPPLVLHGTVVPMRGDSLRNGAVYIANGRITAVAPADAPAPDGFAGARTVDTDGVIYPGLLDLHNHLPYNILPMWRPPRRFDNRLQWQRRPEYRRDVTEPMRVIVDSGQEAIKAIIRYVEVKLLLGGVTSVQGLHSSFGGNRLYRGVVRNFEAPDDSALQPAGSRVRDIDEDSVADVRQSLETGRPLFFHLAEGRDTWARRQFTLLRENSLLRPNLVGIHSLALRPDQHRTMTAAKSWVVWSPLSNSILYGETIDPAVLFDTQSLFGLGCDWTPSGSRNILMELKVALLRAQQVDSAEKRFGFEDLAKAVTRRAATVAGWQDHVGTIEVGKLADLLVLDARHDDPYENLVCATEREVRLVMVGGVPRYGDRMVMQVAGVAVAQMEPLVVGGRQKRLHLHQTDSPLGTLTFDAARTWLVAAMSDLNAVRDAPAPIFEPLADESPIEIDLDMQAEDIDLGPMPMADLPPLSSVTLDAPTVIDDPAYFDALEAIEHLPEYYKGANSLRGFYS